MFLNAPKGLKTPFCEVLEPSSNTLGKNRPRVWIKKGDL